MEQKSIPGYPKLLSLLYLNCCIVDMSVLYFALHSLSATIWAHYGIDVKFQEYCNRFPQSSKISVTNFKIPEISQEQEGVPSRQFFQSCPGSSMYFAIEISGLILSSRKLAGVQHTKWCYFEPDRNPVTNYSLYNLKSNGLNHAYQLFMAFHKV